MSTNKQVGSQTVEIENPDDFILEMVIEWQASATPSDRNRVDSMVAMAVLAGQITTVQQNQYEKEKNTKFII